MTKILVLDNDIDTLEAMQEVLIYTGFEAIGKLKTNNIISLIDQHQPNLMIIDYLLDDVNGGELCHQVKQDPTTCHLPVIIVSAYSLVFNSWGNYGCDAFISKPFDLDEMTQVIHELLNKPFAIS